MSNIYDVADNGGKGRDRPDPAKEFAEFKIALEKGKKEVKPPFVERIPIGGSRVNPRETDTFRKMIKAGSLNLGQTWQKRVRQRRLVVILLSLVISFLFAYIAFLTFASHIHLVWIRYLFCGVYFLLTYHATSSFLRMLVGNFFSLKDRRYRNFPVVESYARETRIAVICPIYHEDPVRVVAAIMAMWEALERIEGIADHYEFHVLSDSRSFQNRIAEEEAIRLAQQKFGKLKIYYRWRSINLNAKLGNIMDFLRRYSSRYKYMVVMDADSLMSGNAVHQMVSIAEKNDRIGIIQTNPRPILRKTVFGRMMQFASWVYGIPFFRAIRHYYLGDAFYVGHNALIRTECFREHCILPQLSGAPPWGGKPLSHDLVEAGLMAKAGYEVWFLPEIEGSFEELPSNILSYLDRERRWMQGNLQNVRVALGFGLKNAHRDLLISGFMAYFVSVLWFALILLTVIANINFDMDIHRIEGLNLEINSLYMLFYVTILLFMPKVLSIFLVLIQKQTAKFGGFFRFFLSCLVETVFSILFSPIVMIFVVKFFVMWIKSIPVKWETKSRGDEALPWKTCQKQFSLHIFAGLLIFMLIKLKDFHYIWDANDYYDFFMPELSWQNRYLWFLPIIIPLILSPMIARFTSFTFRNGWFAGLFQTPEETAASPILVRMQANLEFLTDRMPDLANEEAALKFAYTDSDFVTYHYAFLLDRQWQETDQPAEATGSVIRYEQLRKAYHNRQAFLHYHYRLAWRREQAIFTAS